jgi:hypothetical protein
MPKQRLLSQTVIMALTGALLLGGCGTARLFADYPAPRSASLDAAPWPRLIDTPTRAVADAAAPDPATGAAIVRDLTSHAEDASAIAARLSGPVASVDPAARTLGAQPPPR